MEKNIIYNLLYSAQSVEEQSYATTKLNKVLTKLSEETKTILKIIELENEKNKIATISAVNSYITFNNYKVDLDDYLWEVEGESIKHDIDIAVDHFVNKKIVDINAEKIQEAFSKYEETNDPSYIKDIDLLEEEQVEEEILYMDSAVAKAIESLRRIKDKENEERVKFSNNFFHTQLITKGFDAGELILIAARPAVGKTAFGLAFAHDFSKQGKRVLFISLEMKVEEILKRMLIAKTGITNHTIESNTKFTDQVFMEFIRAGNELKQQPLMFMENPSTNFKELKEQIVKEHNKKELDVIIIDYLGLISSYDNRTTFDLRTTVTFISRGLKLLAMELGIPIIALQQVRRPAQNVSNKKIGDTQLDASYYELEMTDLRESGSLEQDANKVFMLYNETPSSEEEYKQLRDYGKTNVIFSIVKNRSGQADHQVKFEFNKNLQRVREVSWLTRPSSFAGGDDK